MVISRRMDTAKLLEKMAGRYTEHDAIKFRDILVESGHSGVDTSYITSTRRWYELLEKLDCTE